MPSLKQEAQDYEPQQLRNVADLEFVDVNWDVKEEKEVEFPYKYVEVQGERYVVKASVLKSIKVLLTEKPDLKLVKVKKTGEGLKTEYTVIPLE